MYIQGSVTLKTRRAFQAPFGPKTWFTEFRRMFICICKLCSSVGALSTGT